MITDLTFEMLRKLVEDMRHEAQVFTEFGDHKAARADVPGDGAACCRDAAKVMTRLADRLAALLDTAREEKPAVVPVPDVQGPDGVCWKQGPAMHRCTFQAGHDGPHQWERKSR